MGWGREGRQGRQGGQGSGVEILNAQLLLYLYRNTLGVKRYCRGTAPIRYCIHQKIVDVPYEVLHPSQPRGKGGQGSGVEILNAQLLPYLYRNTLGVKRYCRGTAPIRYCIHQKIVDAVPLRSIESYIMFDLGSKIKADYYSF
jgi:hypothetical protein